MERFLEPLRASKKNLKEQEGILNKNVKKYKMQANSKEKKELSPPIPSRNQK